MAAPLLDIRELSVFYGQFRALSGVCLSVMPGEVVSIIGANGAGKSSLLKAIMGQVERIEGEIFHAGSRISGQATDRIAGRGIALVPEGRRLFASLSIQENLQIGADIGRPGEIGLREVFALFPQLEERRHHKAGELSGGQQQMVAFGRALMANPSLLLCDEISLGLAPLIINTLYQVIPDIKARGIGIIIVEQDITRSLAVADRFYCLLKGQVTLSGAPAEVTREDVASHYFGL